MAWKGSSRFANHLIFVSRKSLQNFLFILEKVFYFNPHTAHICIFLLKFMLSSMSDKFYSHIIYFFLSHCRFQIDKRCQHRCSWKCFSIALILLSIVLATMVAYFASKSLVIFLLSSFSLNILVMFRSY